MKMPEKIDPAHIAPCGIICLFCAFHLRAEKPCGGCHAPAEESIKGNGKSCAKKRCAEERGHQWCFQCAKFPCARIKDLNKRYMRNYGMDLVRDGLAAKENALSFMEAKRAALICPRCGGIMDCHYRKCGDCGGL